MTALSDKIKAAHDAAEEVDVAESAIIDQIKASHDVFKDIEWPGVPGVKVRMRLLTVSEARKAKVDNQQEFNRDGIEIGMQNLADYREQKPCAMPTMPSPTRTTRTWKSSRTKNLNSSRTFSKKNRTRFARKS